MLQHIKIKDCEYPVNFGIRALASTADQLGLKLDSLTREIIVPDMLIGRMIEVVTVVAAEAMTDGARKSGVPKRYTPDDIVDMIDEDPNALPALLEMFRASIGSGSAVFQPAAGKGAAPAGNRKSPKK